MGTPSQGFMFFFVSRKSLQPPVSITKKDRSPSFARQISRCLSLPPPTFDKQVSAPHFRPRLTVFAPCLKPREGSPHKLSPFRLEFYN